MNIAKKISASANCRYGDPPVTVKKKVPSNAIAPTKAQMAVTTLEVRLSNMRASLSSLMGSEAIVPERVHYLLQEGLGYSFWPFLLLGLIHRRSAWKVNSRKSALKVREGAGAHAVP